MSGVEETMRSQIHLYSGLACVTVGLLRNRAMSLRTPGPPSQVMPGLRPVMGKGGR